MIRINVNELTRITPIWINQTLNEALKYLQSLKAKV